MSRLNKIILIGNVTSDPETKAVTSGDTVTNFTLQVDRPSIENVPAQSDIFTIIAWRDLAETAASLQQGQQILVEGSIRNRNYETNEGQRVYVTEIEARSLSILGSAIQPVAEPSIPVLEEKPAEAVANFDFNEAIKETKEPEFAVNLGEDVPF